MIFLTTNFLYSWKPWMFSEDYRRGVCLDDFGCWIWNDWTYYKCERITLQLYILFLKKWINRALFLFVCNQDRQMVFNLSEGKDCIVEDIKLSVWPNKFQGIQDSNIGWDLLLLLRTVFLLSFSFDLLKELLICR